MSDGFTTVDTQHAMDAFLHSVGHFHDALLRETGIVSRGYVDTAGDMHGDLAPCDARLVFHSQYPQPTRIEIVLEELQTLRLQDCQVLSGDAEGSVTPEGVALFLGDGPSRGSFRVAAKRMKYRITGRESLGKEVLTVESIAESEC